MADVDAVRRLALALDGAVEQPHHGIPSFRVRKRIFATLPDADHVNVMLDEEGIEEAVATDPVACEAVWWGRKLAAVRVRLAAVDEEVVEGLLREAWGRLSPTSG